MENLSGSKNQSSDVSQLFQEVDCALEKERRSEQSTIGSEGDSFPTNERMMKLTKLLRLIASGVLCAAACVFLFQGWEGWDSATRIFAFMGFIATLVGTGLFCGLYLKDDKGARVSLAVSLAVVPVLASQIGGLLYSLVPGSPRHLNTLIQFNATSLPSALGTLLVGIGVALPVILLGFSTLARGNSRRLSLLYLISNATLLLPTRSGDTMGLVALLMLIGLTISDISYFRPESKLRNFEGRLARLLLFVPLGILLGRNIAIYDVTPILCGSILAGIGSLLFWGLPSYVENKSLIRFTQGLSAIPFSGAWFYIAIALFFSGHNGAYLNLAETAFLPVMFFPISGLFIALSFMSEGLGRGFRALGSGVAITAALYQLSLYSGFSVSLLLLTVSVGVLVFGFATEEKATFFIGVSGLLYAVLYHLRFAIDIYASYPWLTLSITGIATLLASSYIEKNYRVLAMTISAFQKKLQDWN